MAKKRMRSASTEEVENIVLDSLHRIAEREGKLTFKTGVPDIEANQVVDGRSMKKPSRATIYRAIQSLHQAGKIKLSRKGARGFFTYSLKTGEAAATAGPKVQRAAHATASEMVSYDTIVQGPLKTISERLAALYSEAAEAEAVMSEAKAAKVSAETRISTIMERLTQVVQADEVYKDGKDGVGSKDGVAPAAPVTASAPPAEQPEQPSEAPTEAKAEAKEPATAAA